MTKFLNDEFAKAYLEQVNFITHLIVLKAPC